MVALDLLTLRNGPLRLWGFKTDSGHDRPWVLGSRSPDPRLGDDPARDAGRSACRTCGQRSDEEHFAIVSGGAPM